MFLSFPVASANSDWENRLLWALIFNYIRVPCVREGRRTRILVRWDIIQSLPKASTLAELSMRISTWISIRISLKWRVSVSNHPCNHIHPQWTSRLNIRNTDIHADIRAKIRATYLGAWFIIDIHGCTDNSTRTSITLWISKRISARTVQPGKPHWKRTFYMKGMKFSSVDSCWPSLLL